ncbi:uncharacterized protein UTRI_02443 [Ustilago trichophora]|uniref:Uncharacterized protein n=1 Tax=Ustilago trichophora TaxID=86804 RepID=A0A5C3E955_9BASI|nr:uncharacterized protein UTRI_02443 [Ustilago trichophora]
MDSIPADQWIGEYARWLRVHEAKLGDLAASAAAAKRNANRDAPTSTLSSTFWNVVSLGTANTATTQSSAIIVQHIVSRFSIGGSTYAPAAEPSQPLLPPHPLRALGLPVGSLDTKFPSQHVPPPTSLFSSLSWFGTSANKPDPSRDVKYIYSCFTKIPSLRLGPIPARKLIQDFEDCPGQSAVPLDVFKNLQMLELDDVDPRTLIGWDRVCIQLRSLTCKKSNIEDLTDLLVDLVVVDTKRRRGEKVDPRRLRRAPPPSDAQEDFKRGHANATKGSAFTCMAFLALSQSLVQQSHICTRRTPFLPFGLTNLDLSSNLLNIVPPALSHLPSLTSLNISDNLIDSVLGIYDTLPAIRVLNLAKNRLESLCGLERLYTLQRIDLRGNAIYEAGEVGRLAPLPAIAEVWVKDNPLVEELVDYRVDCFVEFAQEGAFRQGSSSTGGSRLVGSPSRNATVRGGKKATGQAAEENEAQLAQDVATTSRNATVVKNVRHRAAPRAANADNARARVCRTAEPAAPKQAEEEGATSESWPKLAKPKEKQRTLTSRRHPIDSSTLGRKSAAARPMASDLFATSSNNGNASAAEAGGATNLAADHGYWWRGEEASTQDTPAALARQRIVRPRQGSSAALARRSRVTTSMYEPDLGRLQVSPATNLSHPAVLLLRANEAEAVHSQANTGSSSSTTTAAATTTTASERSEAFRRRIEALKSEVGDDWLRLLARGGGTAGDRNSAAMLMLSDANNEDGASQGGTEAKGEVTRVVRPKKSKKKMRTSHNNHMKEGEGSSRRTSMDRTEEMGSSRRREARIT